jgi:radical SAM protein with 4Fe4S-binding SPASM domain
MIPDESKLFFEDVHILHVNPSNACNLRCSYCAVHATKDLGGSTRMAPTECLEIVEFCLRAVGHDHLTIEITGGEPLLLGKAWFEEVLRSLRDRRLRVAFTTNATLLDDEWADMLRRYNVNPNVSLDGPAESHNGQRGLYERVLCGLKILQRHGMNPHVITIATAAVLDRIEDLLTLYSSLGIQTFYLNDVRDHGRAAVLERQLIPTPEAMVKASLKVMEHLRECRLALREMELLERVVRFFHASYYDNFCNKIECPAGSAFLSVNASGDVFPCPNVTSSECCLGNIYDGCDPVRRERLLQEFHAMPLFYVGCLTCKASEICFFGCAGSRAQAMVHAQRDCEYTQLLWELFQEKQGLVQDLYQLGMSSARRPNSSRPSSETSDSASRANVVAPREMVNGTGG